jgi:hypothetical protein
LIFHKRCGIWRICVGQPLLGAGSGPQGMRAQTWLMERFQQERLEMSVFEVPLEVPILDVYALP